MATTQNTARLEARISTELHALLKRAAETQGRTVTDFVISAVKSAAETALEESDILRLSMNDQSQFAGALASPPLPADALKRAFDRQTKWVVAE